jgi:ribulose-phosphate 3-epimerase
MGAEYHWMVSEPAALIPEIRGSFLHFVHAEAVRDWEGAELACREAGGSFGVALNPGTEWEEHEDAVSRAACVLVMAVTPGKSSQAYMPEIEGKVASLRKRFPRLCIEVDGGIGMKTARGAVLAGASRLAACSAIFGADDPQSAYRALLAEANGR